MGYRLVDGPAPECGVVIVVVCSWVLTLAFVLYSLRAHLRLVLVARACHELRGPLFAVQLGLHGLVGDPARMAAIELELARAGRALDDLAAAPRGRRVAVARRARRPRRAARVLRAGLAHPGRGLRRDAASAPEPLARPRRPSPVPGGSSAARASSPPTRCGSPRPARTSIGNAAEHGDGEVRVRVRAGGGVVRIEVADDGPGLPASVTTMTAQARARRGRRGHGLAIAAAIAADHGGRALRRAVRVRRPARVRAARRGATAGGGMTATGGGCVRNVASRVTQRTHPLRKARS